MNREQMLELLSRLAEGVAQTFGTSCETLVQDLSQADIPVLAIYNGHVSGRKVGSTVDIFGTTTENRDVTKLLQRDMTNMMVVRGNQKIKSTTIIFRGQDYCLGFGINVDITLSSAYAEFLMTQFSSENYLASAIDSLKQGHLEEIFQTCVDELGMAPEHMHKENRISLISLLQQQGAFAYQKAVPFVAEKLGVSRFTVYNYLKQLDVDTKN